MEEKIYVVPCDFSKTTPPLRRGDFVVFMSDAEWKQVSKYKREDFETEEEYNLADELRVAYIKEHGYWGEMVSRTDDHMVISVQGKKVRVPVEEVKCAILRRES